MAAFMAILTGVTVQAAPIPTQPVTQPALQAHIQQLFQQSTLKDSATYACQRNYRSGRAPANRYRTIHHYRAELERSLRADPTNPRFRMTYSKTVLSATVLRGWHANFYYAAIQKDALQTYSCALVRK